MSRLSDTTFPNPFSLAVKMRCITSMGIKIFTIDVAGQCEMGIKGGEWYKKVNTYVCVCKGRCQKKIKDRDFSLSRGGVNPIPYFFFVFF